MTYMQPLKPQMSGSQQPQQPGMMFPQGMPMQPQMPMQMPMFQPPMGGMNMQNPFAGLSPIMQPQLTQSYGNTMRPQGPPMPQQMGPWGLGMGADGEMTMQGAVPQLPAATGQHWSQLTSGAMGAANALKQPPKTTNRR